VDFGFSETQEQLRDSVRRFLAAEAPIDLYVRAQLETDTATTTEVWRGLADLGATGLLVPEPAGGAGMGMVDMAVVLEEMGRVVHPGPFASTAVSAASLLRRSESDATATELAREIADGSARVAVAMCLPGAAGPAPTIGAGGVVSGKVAAVADAGGADAILVAATSGGEPVIAVVETGAPGLATIPEPTVDQTRRFATVVADNCPARLLAISDAGDALAETVDRTLLATIVDGVGAAGAAMALAVDYAGRREQFGQPIGSFQAVQHLCADMLRAVELGRAAAYYACWACDAGDPAERHRAVTLAAAYTGDAFYQVGASAIQVLGGIGFTWEHDAHLFYKRLLTLQQAGGPPHAHLEELATILLD